MKAAYKIVEGKNLNPNKYIIFPRFVQTFGSEVVTVRQQQGVVLATLLILQLFIYFILA